MFLPTPLTLIALSRVLCLPWCLALSGDPNSIPALPIVPGVVSALVSGSGGRGVWCVTNGRSFTTAVTSLCRHSTVPSPLHHTMELTRVLQLTSMYIDIHNFPSYLTNSIKGSLKNDFIFNKC